MRGKDSLIYFLILLLMGSPPLARERHRTHYLASEFHRITPACAGKTLRLLTPCSNLWDHPRLRGKDSLIYFLILLSMGSPPLARERLKSVRLYAFLPGITPACAGKTVKDPFILATIADFKSQIYLTSVQDVLPAPPSPMLDKAHFH